MQFYSFFTKKKIIWATLIVLIIVGAGYMVSKGKDPAAGITTETAKKQDIKQTVLTTGQVVSTTDLELSFKTGGIVQRVLVKEGDKVAEGQLLANIEQRDQQAQLTSARGALAQAQANYDRVLAGASSEEVAVAQKAVEAAQVSMTNAQTNLKNVRLQQELAVKNAFTTLLSSGLAAVPSPNNLSSATVTVSGSYTGTEQGSYKISLYNTGSSQRFQASGLEKIDGDVKSMPVPFGTRGLFIQFDGATNFVGDTWTINIPNTSASTYVANSNAYQTAIKSQSAAADAAESQIASAQIALEQAKANLSLKQSQARPADVAGARAQIISAQGQVEAAASSLENTIIRSPAAGTVTDVNVKVGELASAQKPVLVLQDIGSLHVEANVSEANIANIKLGQSVDITFDALGADDYVKGMVQTINPASTLVSGVVNYKVTVSVDNNPAIKPGMTANMTILVNEKTGVVTIPTRAVMGHDGKKFARVVDDPKKKTYHETEIQTGLEADGGVVEVVSGLSAGTEIVTYIKK